MMIVIQDCTIKAMTKGILYTVIEFEHHMIVVPNEQLAVELLDTVKYKITIEAQ
jgi:hypothetical protein